MRFLSLASLLSVGLALLSLTQLSAQSRDDFNFTAVSEDPYFGKIALWKEAELPVKDLASSGVYFHEGKLYVFGGHLGDQHFYKAENFTNKVWVLDLKEKPLAWKELPSKPLATLSPGIAFYDGAFYAMSGFMLNAEGRFTSNSQIEKFDLKTQKWTILDLQLQNRSSGAFFTDGGSKAYFAGGWNVSDNEYKKNVVVLDLATMKVSDHPAELPDPVRRAVTAISIDADNILILGGLMPEPTSPNRHRVLHEIVMFHPNAKDGKYWEDLGSLPFASTNPNIAVIKDQIFVLGGYQGEISNFGKAKEHHSEVYTRPLKGGEWTKTRMSMSEKRAFSKVISLGDLGVASLGGYVQNGRRDPVDPSPTSQGCSPSPMVEIFLPK